MSVTSKMVGSLLRSGEPATAKPERQDSQSPKATRIEGSRGSKRLSWRCLALTLVACSGESTPVAPPPSRVVAVTAEQHEAESVDTFCESQGADFSWPSLDGDAPSSSGWRWVNVWATWCRPCIEEMPRLQSFRDRLRAENIEVELVFLSADAEASAVEAFHAEHPGHPTGPRASDLETLRAWFAQLGLDEGAPLPVHLFVKPDGKLACARTAAISDDDYESVKSLLSR